MSEFSPNAAHQKTLVTSTPLPRAGMPSSIGPYRLGEPLGRGGMGEVYRGYDERLDRQVALKRVRAGVHNPDIASRRLQREARAAARLRHPSIVQVYDWVETGDEAWLVMELVEGQSLRELLHSGPLGSTRVVNFARDLLEGLAVAHEAGLVHRDFKAENIMITTGSTSGRGRGEQARILDFGLAKKTTPEIGDTQLSVEGKILGTFSAMAPEQVLGEEVDGRTDLFALGCLLYEALTGYQPFVGSNAGETLNRICTVHQLPAHERLPSISPSFSAFVDHLLEKDRRRRPPSADDALDILDGVSTQSSDSLDTLETEDFATAVENSLPAGRRNEVPSFRNVAHGPLPQQDAESSRASLGGESIGSRRTPVILAVVLMILALVGLSQFYTITPPEPIYVAIPQTMIGPGVGSDEELAAQAIHAALVQGLVDLRDVIALEVPAAETETSDPKVLAQNLAADEVLTSQLNCGAQGCRTELRRVRGEDGGIVWARSFSADTTRLLDLSQAVLGYLPGAFPETERRAGAARFEVEPADYEKYLRLRLQLLHPEQGVSRKRLLDELANLGEATPKFAAIPVLEAHVALGLFRISRSPEELERATQALERARSLAPEDPQVLILAARAARYGRDLDKATELLETLRQLEPGNVEAQFQRALIHESEGEFEQATALVQEAVRRWPSPDLMFSASDLFSRHGDFANARELIERGLSRAPESFDGLSRLAQLELTHGDLQRAAELYSSLVERSPESAELNNLGTALMMLGRFDEAIDCFEKEFDKNPDSAYAALSLADVTMLDGDVAQALVLYQRAADLAAADPRPERLESIRAQALAHLGRREQAVEAVQAAIQHRPDHPWTAYQAALVYVLIEEHTSALWNARRALEHGIEPRWFSLAWFDPIREALRENGPT